MDQKKIDYTVNNGDIIIETEMPELTTEEAVNHYYQKLVEKASNEPEKKEAILNHQEEIKEEIKEVIREDMIARRVDNFVQQNSPVNNELIRNGVMNELYGSNIDGQISIMPTSVLVKGKTKKTEPVYSFCSFSYDDNVDLEKLNKNGRYQITGYDRRVYNAVGTLWLNGKKAITLTEIFSVMNGYARTNPNARQLDAIEKSLNKLKSIKLFIDLSEEVRAHMIEDKEVLVEAGILKDVNDNIKSAVIEDNMLHYSVATITSESGKVFKTIKIAGEPSLLTYNRAKGTLLTIPMEYIGTSESSATEKTIAFQDYLLMRIVSYRNKKMFENKIMYDTLYRDSGVKLPSNPVEAKRDRETVYRLLKEWIDKGLINGYEDIKDGRTFIGVEFFAEQTGIMEKKAD